MKLIKIYPVERFQIEIWDKNHEEEKLKLKGFFSMVH